MAGAVYLTNKLAWNHWMEVGPTNERPYAFFLAGGPASGKTGGLVKLMPEAMAQAGIFVDSPLANTRRAHAMFNEVLNRGFPPSILFVFRPFQMAVQGSLKRLIEAGRPTPITFLAVAHFDALQTFLTSAVEFGDRATFKVAINETDDPKTISYGTVDQLAKIAYESSYGIQATEETKTPEGDLEQSSSASGLGRGIHPGSEGLGARESRQASADDLVGKREGLIVMMEHQALVVVNAALASGKITNAQWRAMVFGDATLTSEQIARLQRGDNPAQ